jgi:hypothetical protein
MCSRLDDGRNEQTGQQKQSHLQNRKTIQMWKTEQSMAERAHPVHTRRPLKSLAHYDLKPPQHFKTVQRDANVVKKPVMNEGDVFPVCVKYGSNLYTHNMFLICMQSFYGLLCKIMCTCLISNLYGVRVHDITRR